MKNITSEEMVTVATIFQDSVKYVLEGYAPESRPKINEFIASIVMRERPYMLVTNTGIAHAATLVFSDDAYRDTILAIAFVFFSRWGGGNDGISALAQNLADGVSGDDMTGPNTAMPADVLRRLPIHNTTQAILANNKWLMILLMLILFIQVTAPEAKKG